MRSSSVPAASFMGIRSPALGAPFINTAWAPGFTRSVFRQGMKAAIIPADIAFRGGPRWHARGERFNADNE